LTWTDTGYFIEQIRNINARFAHILARLKRRLATLERPFRKDRASVFGFGLDTLDARLGGGLARGAVHEVLPGSSADHAAASGFALMLALRAAGNKPILWVRDDRGARMTGNVYAPGLVELGIDPARIMMVRAPDELAVLRTASDALGCAGLGAAVIEPGGEARKLDLTASRRLALAAEKSGVTCVVLRSATSIIASAASTRWQVASAPSAALAGNAPGHTVLALELVRHRGGIAPFETFVEWDRDQLCFAQATLSGLVLPLSARRSADLGDDIARAA
jgi:protein ImuA